MSYCAKCGSEVIDQNAFCPKCGAPASGAAVAGSYGDGSAAATSPVVGGLTENLAGLLCYLVGFITGIVFLIADKRPFVRFHAAQSVAVFGILFVIGIVIDFAFMPWGGLGLSAILALISFLVWIVSLAAWIGLMMMAYRGKKYQVPGLEGLVKSIQGKAA